MSPSSSPLIDRLRAGALHLALSAGVAGLAALLIFRIWYPPPLATMQGVDQLVLLLVAVDVVLGPLLTTIVYRRGKPSLRFDLAVIAVLQLSALGYGLATIHAGRPALIVFNVDRFDVVAAGSVDADSAARARAAGLPPLPQFGPAWRVARLPGDPESRNALIFSTLKGGPDLPLLPHLQQPYDAAREQVRPLLKPIAELRAAYRLDEADWRALLITLDGRDPGQLGWLPVIGKVRDGVVVASTADGAIVGIRLPRPAPQPVPSPG